MKTVIYLIHGTWPRGPFPGLSARWRRVRGRGARPPLWFEEGSGLRAHLRDELGEVDFVPIDWSGGNTFSARSRGAERLRIALRDRVCESPEASHFVLAHSHGGNVAMEALRGLDPRFHPRGIATLATPFLVVERRRSHPLESRIYRVSMICWFFLFYFFMFAVSTLVIGRMLPKSAARIRALPPATKLGIVLALFGSPVVAVNLFACAAGCLLRRPIAARRRSDLRRLTTSTARRLARGGTSLLIVRAPGDEASLALTSTGAFAAIHRLLWAMLTAPIRRLISVGTSHANGLFSFLFTVALILAALKMSLDLGWLGVFDRPAQYVGAILSLTIFFLIASPIVTVVSAAAIVPPFFFLSALLLFPFGPDLILSAPHLLIHAESAPPGTVSRIVMVPGDEIRRGMRHSLHAAPSARSAFVDWVKELVG